MCSSPRDVKGKPHLWVVPRPRSHDFSWLAVSQTVINYCGEACPNSTVESPHMPLSPHSGLRHIGATYAAERFSPHSLLWSACHVQGQEGEGGAHLVDGGAGSVDQG